MKRVIEIFNRFWFAEAPPERLAVLRILIGSYALYYVGTRYSMLMDIAVTAPELFDPVGAASVLQQPVSALLFKLVVIITLVFNVLFIFGWKFRYTGPVFSLLLLAVLSYRNSWSMIYHFHNVLVFHCLIMGFTRAADALSFDSLLKLRNSTGGEVESAENNSKRPYASWRYGWPIMLMCAVTLCTYFLAGLAKVESPSGWAWMNGESLRSQVAVDGLRKEILGSGAPGLVYYLYNNLFLFTVLGVATFFLELGAPIALFNRRLGKIWAISAFFMHWGIFFIMDIKFRYQLSGILFTTFFDMERVLFWIKPGRKEQSNSAGSDKKLVVLFDGVCKFCNGTVKFILERDKEKLFKFAPLQSLKAEELLKKNFKSDHNLNSIVLIEDKKVYTKSSAFLRILKRLPGFWMYLYFLIFVPRPVRDFFYDRFARYRYGLFGKETSCLVPTKEIKEHFLE